jgi:type II secretory pathway pseudopilin PulG
MTEWGRSARDACAGFTLVELLVSSAITITIAVAVLGFASQAQQIFQSQPEASDVHQRLRVGVDSLQHDLIMAGAGTSAGPATGALTYFLSPILPYVAFGDTPDPARGIYFRSDTISILYIPPTPSQSRLAAPLSPGGLDVRIDSPPNCPAATVAQICGLEAGDRVLVFDDASQWDIFSVDQVGSGGALLQHRASPSVSRYDTGAALAEARIGTYHLKTDEAAQIFQLMRHDGWASDLPMVDDVVGLGFEYFGDPEPPRLSGTLLGTVPGPWTTYGPAPPLVGEIRGTWPEGENCAFLVVNGQHTPRLAVLGGGGFSLVELPASLLTDGPWCPDAFASNRFDADLLRVRKVRVTLRVQSALASLRGPAGLLFRKGGTARAGSRYVPDLEVQFDVTPRNMNLGR